MNKNSRRTYCVETFDELATTWQIPLQLNCYVINYDWERFMIPHLLYNVVVDKLGLGLLRSNLIK